MKKILFIAEAMGGGVFTYLVDLANELSAQYDITVAYALRPQTPKNYKEYFNSNVQMIEVKNFTRNISFASDLRALFEIKRIVHKVQPNVIHLHSSKAGVLGRLAFWHSKIPLFYTPHGYSFLMEEMSFAKRRIYFFIERAMALCRCTTISCSEGEHKQTLKLTKRAEYINNGINVDELNRQLDTVNDAMLADGSFSVFTLGRICFQKNPTLFNEIAVRMPDVHFLWIGDGECKSELTAPNIEVTGWVNREEALEYAVHAGVFILTSRWEGLPISLLEAMYMNKPCIVSDIIGNHDVVQNEINGIVCNTADQFAEAIERFRQDKEFSEKCCRQAYQDVLTEYNTKIMAQKYAAVYEKETTDEKGCPL